MSQIPNSRESTNKLQCTLNAFQSQMSSEDTQELSRIRFTSEDGTPSACNPIREYFKKAAKIGGMAIAMATGSGLSLNVSNSPAHAGFILSLSQGGNDQAAKATGQQRTVDSGDIQGWFSVEYDSPATGQRTTLASSAWAYTPSDVALATHQIKPYLNLNPVFRFGTGSNYFTDPGRVFEISSFVINDAWQNSSSNSTVADIAVGHLNGEIANFAFDKVVFADSRPADLSILNWAGYGQPGSPDTGLLPADGYIRGGTTLASLVNPFGGASPSLYIGTKWFDDGSFLPGGMMATQGASSALIRDQNGRILAQYNRGSIGPTAGVAYGIDYTNEANRNFLFTNSSYSAVPEPSSLVMAGIAAAAAAAGGAFRRQVKRPIAGETPNTLD